MDEDRKIMEFFGVRTENSQSRQYFPDWARALGVQGAGLRGVNLPIDGTLDAHREAVLRMKQDPEVHGALVTSHKLAIVRAAGDLIDRRTSASELTGEVSALYKRGDELWGHAVDPENYGLAITQILSHDWWARHEGAGILSLGGGGATVALIVYLLQQAIDRPAFLQIVEKRSDNLDHCKRIANRISSDTVKLEFFHTNDPLVCDSLVAALPPYSLVINATGMGKDIPGSPVTDNVYFPDHTVVWDLNYRGPREFLVRGELQRATRPIKVFDGWYYFLRGWSSVMGLVFDIPMTKERLRSFCEVTEG
ncbi:MAG: hypothetical protein TQ37_01535 [Candidatus Synechococcus spongiarum 15L]|uniref:Shikimate dehydrogenase n=1 Tax=Candidatus Synechococcus spongiarum 15L TaxID=1608419 RepID=A0A0G8AY87_9SYNE|nr:MAG: hypothetical protein TQ37_01535 [Candidatus Synechococcus spongiarum 15L]MCY4672494.1 shikimate dehydrogenase [Bacteroidota bacterium]